MPDLKPEDESWFQEFKQLNTPPPAVPAKTPSSGENAAADRRRHLRFEVDEARATLYREGFLSTFGLTKENKARAALDISQGGVRLLTSERIPPGTKVRIRVEMEKYQDAIEAVGVIRWSFQSTGNATDFYAGAMFVDLDSGQAKKIGLMREWFTSPQYKALKENRATRKSSNVIFPK
jgi:hypothetical protein